MNDSRQLYESTPMSRIRVAILADFRLIPPGEEVIGRGD